MLEFIFISRAAFFTLREVSEHPFGLPYVDEVVKSYSLLLTTNLGGRTLPPI